MICNRIKITFPGKFIRLSINAIAMQNDYKSIIFQRKSGIALKNEEYGSSILLRMLIVRRAE